MGNGLKRGPVGKGAAERDALETVLAMMPALLEALNEIAIRNTQAVARSGLVEPVLQPALERLAGMQADLEMVRAQLIRAWEQGQRRRWQDDQ